MRRFTLYLIVILILLLAGGFLALGMFPPEPERHPVERVLPNESFQTR